MHAELEQESKDNLAESLDDEEYFADYYDFQEPEMVLGENWQVYEEQRKRPALLVSACLLGADCRYDGSNNLVEAILDLKDSFRLVPVCPEVLGGLAVPRAAAERKGDKIINNEGEDVSAAFYLGAEKAWAMYRDFLCDAALLKAKSPSCGAGKIYDGTFTRTLIDADGATAELLKKNGVAVFTEKELDKLQKYFKNGEGAKRVAELKKGLVMEMLQSALECKFEKEMLEKIAEAEKLGCVQKQLKANISQYGAAATMENLIKRRQVSEGYDCLEKLGRLDLSAEAVTVKSIYGELFSDEEVNVCFDLLCASKFYK